MILTHHSILFYKTDPLRIFSPCSQLWSSLTLNFASSLTNEKNRNAEYHSTTNKKKYFFWNEIAEKLNVQERTNYFTGDECHKKFLSLTKAFYVSRVG